MASATTTPSTPFFRFPGFETTQATLDLLQSRGIVVFGTDLWASDWNKMTPKQELKLLIDRLKVARKGIILLHDPKAQTAAMLPAFLRYLRDNTITSCIWLPPASTLTARPDIGSGSVAVRGHQASNMCEKSTIKAAFITQHAMIL